MRSGFFNSEIIGYDAENMPIFDRAEEASFFAKYFSQFISNGVFSNPSTNMQVLVNNGMSVKVNVGVCFINGYMGWVETEETLEIETCDSHSRIDRIVARLDFEDRSIGLFVKKGEESGNPTAPELQRDYDIYELGLADITIKTETISIAQQDIKDLRLSTEFCGTVQNPLEHVDTETLFKQYEDWYKTTTGQAEADLVEMKEKFTTDFTTWFNATKKAYNDWFEPKETEFNEWEQNQKDSFSEWRTSQEQDFDKWFETIKGKLSGDIATKLENDIETLQTDVENLKNKDTEIEKNIKENLSRSLSKTIQSEDWQEYQDNDKTKYKYEVTDEKVTENHLVQCFLNEDEQEKVTGRASTKSEEGKYTLILTEKPEGPITMDIVITKTGGDVE